MEELEITKVENGWVIHEGVGYVGSGLRNERRRWVVSTAEELGKLVVKLVERDPKEKASEHGRD